MPNGYWNHFNTLCEIVSVMRTYNLELMPTAVYLNKIKRSDLNSGIRKNGGFHLFRVALGEKPNSSLTFSIPP